MLWECACTHGTLGKHHTTSSYIVHDEHGWAYPYVDSCHRVVQYATQSNALSAHRYGHIALGNHQIFVPSQPKHHINKSLKKP